MQARVHRGRSAGVADHAASELPAHRASAGEPGRLHGASEFRTRPRARISSRDRPPALIRAADRRPGAGWLAAGLGLGDRPVAGVTYWKCGDRFSQMAVKPSLKSLLAELRAVCSGRKPVVTGAAKDHHLHRGIRCEPSPQAPPSRSSLTNQSAISLPVTNMTSSRASSRSRQRARTSVRCGTPMTWGCKAMVNTFG